MEPPTLVFGQDFGPLVDQNGNNVPFAPLLRTREALPYGMLRSSWTLYQPHALVWNYAYWNGRANFGSMPPWPYSKIPQLKWEQIIPPPFLKAWHKFLQVCENRSIRGKDMDAILSPLLPLFHCECYNLPFRVLKEEEVAALSGLHGFWTRISSEDAEALPEHLVGNCFHPALISSALGKNDILRRWAAGGEGGPSTFVADQSETFKVFATLCDRVETEAKRRGKKEKLDIDRTLPPFHTVELRDSHQRYSHVVSEKPEVLPPLMGGCKKVRVTKTERHIQQCIDAALHKLEENQCLALRTVGLERIFDGLRATSFIPFQFRDYAACIIGEDPTRLRQFASRFPHQCPSLQLVETLRFAFRHWEAHPTLCTLMSVLVAATHLKKDSVWPTGHVLLIPGQDTNQVCYIGADAPKLLLLVNAARPQAPDVYVVEAAAYQRTIQLGRLFIACQQSWPDTQLQPDVEYSVELRDGQGILNVGAYHCQQEGCLLCFLAGSLQIAFCPWHTPPVATGERGRLSVANFFCTKNLSTSTVDLVGQLL